MAILASTSEPRIFGNAVSGHFAAFRGGLMQRAHAPPEGCSSQPLGNKSGTQ